MKKLALIITTAVFAFGCGSSKEVANAPSTNAPVADSKPANTEAIDNATVNPEKFTAGENPKGDVVFASRKQGTAPIWSMTVSSESMPNLNMQMEHIAPDRWHFKQSAGEVIVIGKQSYVNRNSKWIKIDDDLSSAIGNQTQLITEESIQRIKDVKKLREETFNGKEAIVYEYTTKDENTSSDAATSVWIEKATGLPLKIELNGMINGKKQTISTVYDYDKKVVIEAPKVE